MVASLSQVKAAPAKAGSEWHPAMFSWYGCGLKLAEGKPLTEKQIHFVLETLSHHSVDKSPDFLMFATTVIAAESGFNVAAASPMGARGLMQVTDIGAREAAAQCRLPLLDGEYTSVPAITLHNPRINVKYGTCLLRYYLEQVNGNHLLALILYNGGYVQLTRFINTGTLTKETSEYVLRVQSYIGRCSL